MVPWISIYQLATLHRIMPEDSIPWLSPGSLVTRRTPVAGSPGPSPRMASTPPGGRRSASLSTTHSKPWSSSRWDRSFKIIKRPRNKYIRKKYTRKNIAGSQNAALCTSHHLLRGQVVLTKILVLSVIRKCVLS